MLHWTHITLHYINRISIFLSAWGCSPQTPESTVFSLANVLFHLAVIHHHRSDGSWITHPSESHQHAASSSQRGDEVVAGKLWFISVIHCCLRSPCVCLHTSTTTVIKRPSCVQMWWRVSQCQPGHKLDEVSWFVEIKNSSPILSCGRSRHAASAP